MPAKRVPPPSGEDFWRQAINSLSGPFPEVGNTPPEMEVETETKDRQGRFLKMSFDVFLFTDDKDNKCYMIYNQQRMWDYGQMALSEALLKAKRGRRRS